MKKGFRRGGFPGREEFRKRGFSEEDFHLGKDFRERNFSVREARLQGGKVFRERRFQEEGFKREKVIDRWFQPSIRFQKKGFRE